MVRSFDLDIDLLRAFVAVNEYSGFTAAGDVLGATQSAVSMRVKKLEQRIGERLFIRTAHSTRLTDFGSNFLGEARRILDLHDEIASSTLIEARTPAFRLGVSDHVAGSHLPTVLAGLKASHPDVRQLVTVAGSTELFNDYTRGDYNAVVVRRGHNDRSGKFLFRDQLGWVSAKNFEWNRNEPLPLIGLAAPCHLRSTAVSALRSGDLSWNEVFIGTGVAAVQAAIAAGLGIGCLDIRNLPSESRVWREDEGLPFLPSSEIVIHRRNLPKKLEDFANSVEEAFIRICHREAE